MRTISDQTRIAVISFHTSPSDRPGIGDAGGLNVYVARASEEMARQGLVIDIFTRARSPSELGVRELFPGVRLVGLQAGPLGHVSKESLPDLVDPFVTELLGWVDSEVRYDLIHSHYWLSGVAGAQVADVRGVPLVHTMHTLGLAKNTAMMGAGSPEPSTRILAEFGLVQRVDALVTNTFDEAGDAIREYGADPRSVHVVWPGVDLKVFRPGSQAAARSRLALSDRGPVFLFVGRMQPLKAPDHFLRVVADFSARNPQFRDQLQVALVGGASGKSGLGSLGLGALADDLGIGDRVRFLPPVASGGLADWYRAADVTIMPSFSESFGLVALESQACGTPVVASDVGGLPTAVPPEAGGFLVQGRDLPNWARAIESVVLDSDQSRRLSLAGPAHARSFDWSRTADATIRVYRSLLAARRGMAGVGAGAQTHRE